jgi:hypothetical protein
MKQISLYAPDLILTLIVFCLLSSILYVPSENSYDLSEQKTQHSPMDGYLLEAPTTDLDYNEVDSTIINSGDNSRATSINYNSRVMKLEAESPKIGMTFQLYKNSTVVNASFNLTGLPIFDYNLWDEISTVSTHPYEFESESPAIAIDDQGLTHVVWGDNGKIESPLNTDWDIIYAKNDTKYKPSIFWPNEIVSTSGQKDSNDPDIFIDKKGNIYITWVDKHDQSSNGDDWDIFYRKYQKIDDNYFWSSPKVISNEIGYGESSKPQVAVNDTGDILIVWSDSGVYSSYGGDYEIYYRFWYNINETWSNTFVLSDYSNDDDSTNPDIAVSGEKFHIVWTESGNVFGSGSDSDIAYSSWDGTQWSSTIIISNTSNDKSNNASVHAMNDDVCIVWDESDNIFNSSTDQDIFMKTYLDPTWSEHELVSNHLKDGNSSNPKVVTGDGGLYHFCWVDSGEILPSNSDLDIIYRNWDSQTDVWNDYIVISDDVNDGESIEPQMTINKNGCVDIIWTDTGEIKQSGEDWDIFHRNTKRQYPTNLKMYVGSLSLGGIDWEYKEEFNSKLIMNHGWLKAKLNSIISTMTVPVADYHFTFESDTDGCISINDFTLTLTATPFAPTNLKILSEDSSHVISHKPIINWEYYDNDSAYQYSFEIRVGSSPGANDIWNSGEIITRDEFIEYNGEPLVDSSMYFYQVRVRDSDYAWSPWSAISSFTMNGRPIITYLSTSYEPGDKYIEVDWSGFDNDNDQLIYILQTQLNGSWNTVVSYESVTYYELNTKGLTSYSTNVNFRVKCFDGFEESNQWYYADSIVIIIHNNPPQLTIENPPKSGGISNDTYRIEWSSFDLDTNDVHSVNIYYDEDKDLFDKILIVENYNNTGEYVWNTTKVEGGPYYICIIISDGKSETYKYSNGSIEIDHSIDTKPPRVVQTRPTSDEKDVAIDTLISVRFNEQLDSTTAIIATNVIVRDSAGKRIKGSITYNGTIFELSFYPDETLDFDKNYSVTLKTGIKDVIGNALDGNGNNFEEFSPEDDYSWNFSTETRTTKGIPIYILSTTPLDQSKSVSKKPTIKAVFSEALDTKSLRSAVFLIDPNGKIVDVDPNFIVDHNELLILLYNDLKSKGKYTVLITAELRDLDGDGLDGNKNGESEGSPIDDYSWSFTTEKLPDPKTPDSGTENIFNSTTMVFIILLIVIIIIVISYLIFKRVRKQKFNIHDIFVVYNDGRLLAHQSFESISNLEESAMGGMLTAIQNFVLESFRDSDTEKLEEIRYGKLKIVLAHGKKVYLAAVCTGEIPTRKFRSDMKNLLSFIEIKYGKVLKKWDGSMKKIRGMHDLIRF